MEVNVDWKELGMNVTLSRFLAAGTNEDVTSCNLFDFEGVQKKGI